MDLPGMGEYDMSDQQGTDTYDENCLHHLQRSRQDLYAVEGGVDSIGVVESRMHALAAAVHSLIERVETAGPCATGLPATKSTLGLFYMEAPALEYKAFCDWHLDASNMDKVEFRGGRCYFIGTDKYIINCKISATSGTILQVKIRVCNESDFEEDKIGFMKMEQYKKLCIFLIARSGSTDLLGDPINDHINFQRDQLIRGGR